jgi:hypothetical protein
MNKRHFTVVIGSKENGLYVSSKPSSAAKKAVTKLCTSNKSKKVEFYLREITQGSKKKTFGPYLGEMKKLKTPIELKGRVIRYETIVHLKKVKNNMKGGLFKCADDKKKIKELCVDDESGEYENKDECETYCLDQKLNTELEAWKLLFEWCKVHLPHNPIYCKGGSALGLEVLKSILNKNPSQYEEFISLNLIKDWDFTVFMSEDEKRKFTGFVQTIGFKVDGKKITMIRFNNALMIGDDYLLELSAKIDQTLDDLELPLTNLKFEVNYDNINLFFEIVKMYVKNDINLGKMSDILNILLDQILVNGINLVDSIENGLYTIIDPGKISTAGLSDVLLRIIDNSVGISNNGPIGSNRVPNRGPNSGLNMGPNRVPNRGPNSGLNMGPNRGLNSGLNMVPNRGPNSGLNMGPNRGPNINRERINPLTMKQFLITQFSQPDRLFLRFFKKNVEKSIKIREFYENNGIPLPPWLIDETILREILIKINRFLDNFNVYIQSMFVINQDFLNDPKVFLKIFIDRMDRLLQGINIPNLKLDNPHINLSDVIKLIPLNIFEILKDNFFKKEKEKSDLRLSGVYSGEELNSKIKARNLKRISEFNYVTFLPKVEKSTGRSNNRVKPVYDQFLRILLNILSK